MAKSLKILIVNWAWYRVAGEWTYIDNVKALYERHGHTVIPFSMKNPKNEDTRGYDKYFVDHIDYKELNKKKNIVNGIKAISKSIYSQEAKKNLRSLLLNDTIDVAHLHDINHYITPSILPLLKEHNIPIIWTLHDYLLLCPEGTFYSNGEICENCKGGKFYNCILQKCKKESLLASTLAAIETMTHHSINIFRHVDYFLCPSLFLYNKFKSFDFYADKLVLTNLCCEVNMPVSKINKDRYILFSGRLARIKGLLTLLNAVKGMDILLYIAGEGPEITNIKKFIADHAMNNVILLGHKSKNDIHELVQNALILVCPSECYENFPYTIIEAMLLKTAVIASSIGGIPELVIDGETGLLFEPTNHLELQEKIVMLLNDEALRKTLAGNAYERTKDIVSYERHYEILKNVFWKIGLKL